MAPTAYEPIVLSPEQEETHTLRQDGSLPPPNTRDVLWNGADGRREDEEGEGAQGAQAAQDG